MDKQGEKNVSFTHRKENDSTCTYIQRKGTNSNRNHLLIIHNNRYQIVNLLYNTTLFQRN